MWCVLLVYALGGRAQKWGMCVPLSLSLSLSLAFCVLSLPVLGACVCLRWLSDGEGGRTEREGLACFYIFVDSIVSVCGTSGRVGGDNREDGGCVEQCPWDGSGDEVMCTYQGWWCQHGAMKLFCASLLVISRKICCRREACCRWSFFCPEPPLQFMLRLTAIVLE